MDHSPPDAPELGSRRRRRLRAVFAADMANFGGLVSVDETNTLEALWSTRRIAREELAVHGGWLFGLPGDGIFALFESAVDAVRCALNIQARLASAPKLNTVRMRIGIHLGEVLFQDELPFGEALVIAARLESLADPGGILISSAVMEAVAPRVSAAFSERGVFSLKHSPRRVTTFSVSASSADLDETSAGAELLDRTVLSVAPEPARDAPARPVAPVLTEAAVPSLPKACQLVVPETAHMALPDPGRRPDPAPPPGPGIAGTALLEGCLTELVQALTVHLGPFAGILVRRYAARFASGFELVDALAQEIPAKADRLQFVLHARQIVGRTHH